MYTRWSKLCSLNHRPLPRVTANCYEKGCNSYNDLRDDIGIPSKPSCSTSYSWNLSVDKPKCSKSIKIQGNFYIISYYSDFRCIWSQEGPPLIYFHPGISWSSIGLFIQLADVCSVKTSCWGKITMNVKICIIYPD